MRINHNLAAANTYRQMSMNTIGQSKSLEKLSSGLRINRAGDDAAGLAISEKMRGQIRGLNQASRNAQDGISMIQTAEGALNEVHDILQRMRELSVQAANSTMESEDRTALGDELLELKNEINRISEDTEFNGKKLLNGSLSTNLAGSSEVGIGSITAGTLAIVDMDLGGAAAGETFTLSAGTNSDQIKLVSGSGASQEITISSVMATGVSKTISFGDLGVSFSIAASTSSATSVFSDVSTIVNNLVDLGNNEITTEVGTTVASFAIGANQGQTMTVTFSDMGADQLGAGVDNIDAKIADDQAVNTVELANTLIGVVDVAISEVSAQRGVFGAAQNRLEHTIKNLDTSSENLQASESRVRDVDMAKEMMEFTKNNILVQAAQSMMAQANQQPQGVLSLLR